MAKGVLKTLFILMFVLPFPFIAFSEEIYEYERMWPVIEQPWYFNRPNSVAVDNNGYVYVVDDI